MANIYNLTNQESMFYTAQCIVNGNWHLFNEDRAVALKKLKMFCGYINLKSFSSEAFLEDIYIRIQSSLMSKRLNTFKLIQFQPPFNDFGQQNFKNLLTDWEGNGEIALERKFEEIFSNGWEKRKSLREVVKVTYGDGATEETAIKFSSSNVKKRINAESWFINYHYGKENEDWKRERNFMAQSSNSDKILNIWEISLADGKRNTFYFNASTKECVAAANVVVGGWVLNANCRGIGGAIVTFNESNGNVRYALTNKFGYYRFNNVMAGNNYTFNVAHKGYMFIPQAYSVKNEEFNLNFVANP